MRLFLLFVSLLLLFNLVYAQDSSDLPEPPFEELPNIVIVLLGAVSSVIVEFVQKQKSRLLSLGIAVGVSIAVGGISAFVSGVPMSDAATFIAQVYLYATASWAIVFKGLNAKKLLGS